MTEQERRRTKEGVVSKIYHKQKRKSRERGHKPPAYSRLELIDWCLNNKDYNKHYDNYVKSGYNSDFIPSIDRVKNSNGYSFDNIRVTNWIGNKTSYYNDLRNGKNNSRTKKVIATPINGGNELEFHSTMDAERKMNIRHSHISECCRGKLNQTGGYYWKYI